MSDKKHYGASLLHATGSIDHLEQLKQTANAKGLDLKADGLYRGKKLIASATEEDIYGRSGFSSSSRSFAKAGMRSNERPKANCPSWSAMKTCAASFIRTQRRQTAPKRLRQWQKRHGSAGFEYFGVADHSQSAHYAGGLSLEEIAAQHREADRLNKRYGSNFRILKGIESDILADGSLDYPDRVLEKFDFVVASVHSRFKMAEERANRPHP